MSLATVNGGNVTASRLLLQAVNASNDNNCCRNVKDMLQMSLNFRPLNETLPSWKVAAYEANTPEFATITFNIGDNEWELRNKFGELVETHRFRDELQLELEVWKQVWYAARSREIPGAENGGKVA